MPKDSENALEQTEDSMPKMAEEVLKGVIPYPVVFCGVNRKVNIGNFENLDVYSAIAVPVLEFPHDDPEAFKEAVEKANEIGFSIVSRETGQRYNHIKELQGGR